MLANVWFRPRRASGLPRHMSKLHWETRVQCEDLSSMASGISGEEHPRRH